MRIGYDAQALLSPNGGTGKGRQLRTLLGPFFSTFTGFASTDPNRSGLTLVQEGAAGYTLWQQFSLPRSLKRHGIELFLAPYNTAPLLLPRRLRLILVLHDTILLQGFRNPDLRGRVLAWYRRHQIPPSVRRAQIVLTVSEHARGEILKRFPKADVRVIPCTIPREWLKPRPLSERQGYLLMVTSSAPHKNAAKALEGYALYVKQAIASEATPADLCIVGLYKQRFTYQAQLAALGVESSLVKFLPFVSEEELIALYQKAEAFLFPSLAEGFGIPLLEAMATGTPVIAARAASLPEVGGEAVVYFDPHDGEAIAAALERVLTDKGLREEMVQKGHLQLERFHPQKVEEQVVAFWQEITGQSPAPST